MRLRPDGWMGLEPYRPRGFMLGPGGGGGFHWLQAIGFLHFFLQCHQHLQIWIRNCWVCWWFQPISKNVQKYEWNWIISRSRVLKLNKIFQTTWFWTNISDDFPFFAIWNFHQRYSSFLEKKLKPHQTPSHHHPGNPFNRTHWSGLGSKKKHKKINKCL